MEGGKEHLPDCGQEFCPLKQYFKREEERVQSAHAFESRTGEAYLEIDAEGQGE